MLSSAATSATTPSATVFDALLFPGAEPQAARGMVTTREGVPFIDRTLPVPSGGATTLEVHALAKHIYVLGLTTTGKPRAWSAPQDSSKHFFVGDGLGRIRLTYEDGAEQIFPLTLGESCWWGTLFYDNPEPFATRADLRRALTQALRLFPAAPVHDGKYVAVITPASRALRAITIEDSAAKEGVPVIDGITIETRDASPPAGALSVPGAPTPALQAFVRTRSLRDASADGRAAAGALEELRRALYSSATEYRGAVPAQFPAGYAGPRFTFAGPIDAAILENAFHFNLQDMAGKIGDDGAYHTSTKDSWSWGSYNGFGTYSRHGGKYYDQAFSRDMGRSLQELTAVGYDREAARAADWALRMARAWGERPDLKIAGLAVPWHWGQIINRPGKGGWLENDGHGLLTLFLFKRWQRLPDGDAWARAHWVDIQAAGDWVLWQFEHPARSGATDVLHTTGEAAAKNGYSVYADMACREGLTGLAHVADAIGETGAAARWRATAERMTAAMERRYVETDPTYGRVWTLKSAGWPHHSTVLGPLILRADDRGLAPEDEPAAWRAVNAATYRRMLDTYRPRGFFGQAMGYGQGFVTQAALLLDQMQDATELLGWAARQIYDPRIGSFIVPEGCEIDPTGRYWYRVGDLGNGVQEAEIVKALRIMVGLDDTRPDRLRLFPRMPYGWTRMGADDLPVCFARGGGRATTRLSYRLLRDRDRMTLEVSSGADVGAMVVRLGPWRTPPRAMEVRANGKDLAHTIEASGDSYWVRFTASVGPRPLEVVCTPSPR